MSRELPILCNTDMVTAILEGRKTVTRRLVKPQSRKACGYYVTTRMSDGKFMGVYDYDEQELMFESPQTPPAQPGDILYVRERWRVGAWDIRNQMIAFDYNDGTCGKPVYISDLDLFGRLVNQSGEDARKAKCEYNGVDYVWKKGESPCRWHPSIHMPKAAARIWLKVTDVRVERLQAMRLNDFLDEGVVLFPEAFNDPDNAYGQAREQFTDIWDATLKSSEHDKYGWEANPWTWVIKFDRCEKPEGEF